MTSAAAHITW